MLQGLSTVIVFLLASLPLVAFALAAGEPAPPFEATSTAGTIRLADYLGKKHVLLAFYIKDFTGG